nr:restriction endonuclease [uncultured Methanobacterium sp.]
MGIPDFQSIMLPLLKFASDKQEHSIREAIESLAQQFDLTEKDRKELLPSGMQPVFDNRVGWSRTSLKKAGLLESKKRGYFNITPEGLNVLNQNPPKIDIGFLMQFPGYVEFRTGRAKDPVKSKTPKEDFSPEETLEYSYQKLRDNIAQELIDNVKSCSPEFFEKLVVDLLLNMGYGGSRRDAGEAIGRSGDGGIDGIIKEDRLGLDTIYIQAKRWDSNVSRPEIQKFAGALQGKQSKKGVFITTSKFSKSANEYASIIDSKLVLIDGEQLAQLMIDYDIGVAKIKSYDLKSIDTDYFSEE